MRAYMYNNILKYGCSDHAALCIGYEVIICLYCYNSHNYCTYVDDSRVWRIMKEGTYHSGPSTLERPSIEGDKSTRLTNTSPSCEYCSYDCVNNGSS